MKAISNILFGERPTAPTNGVFDRINRGYASGDKPTIEDLVDMHVYAQKRTDYIEATMNRTNRIQMFLMCVLLFVSISGHPQVLKILGFAL